MTDTDAKSALEALRDILTAVAVLDTYENVVGVQCRNTVWRAAVDLIRHATTTLQIPPHTTTKVLHKAGFINLQIRPTGELYNGN